MPAEEEERWINREFVAIPFELKQIPLHTDTAISCNSIKKKKKEEEIVPFERISCLSPQLAMRLAEATEQFGGSVDLCEVCEQ